VNVTGWSPAVRISLGLVVVTSCILLVGDLAGLTPGRSTAVLEARKQLCEALAVQYARDAQDGDWAAIRSSMEQLLRRNEAVQSAGLRSADGTLLVHAGDHLTGWEAPPEGKSTPTHAQVPVYRGDGLWGTVEMHFAPVSVGGLAALWASPIGRLILFVGLLGFVAYLIFLRRTLRHLDPSAVIPARVRLVLDTLAEGVVLLDRDARIVLANQAFAERLGSSADVLIGERLSRLSWKGLSGNGADRRKFPWSIALRQGERSTGTALTLKAEGREPSTFVVSSSPIVDESGVRRGALATFDDVTELQKKKLALERTLDDLRKSQEEIRLQNEELKVLATLDPLTTCLNRRSFMELFEREFRAAQRGDVSLHCLMADLDHFKKVNDIHGHNVGDRALEVVAATLGSRLRSSDAICRWGGEEFCIMLLNREWATVQAEAELARRRVEETDPDAASLPDDVCVTVSIGLASMETNPSTALELIEQADHALYVSKQRGRNQVTYYTPEIRDFA
jgi:diguanylate cyclase (GGDEF)-like protein/PAS domain S-box-containing protein